HSGDTYAVYPAQGLERAELDHIVDYTVRIARHLRLRGLVNVQYVVHRSRVYVLEVNPRASRTVPFLSKVTGVPMVRLATRVMLGEKLADLGWSTGLVPARELVAVKAPVFSMNKLAAVDSYLGPEMKSTGEAIGIGRTLHQALRKAFAASGMHVERGSAALLTIADADKPELFPIVSRLVELGCKLVATEGTARALRAAGFSPRVVAKIGEEGPTVVDVIVRGEVKREMFVLTMHAPEIAATVRAGQFVNLSWTSGQLLRRPFSVYRADGDNIEVVLKAVGAGTGQLLAMELGDRVSCLGPLGHGF